jgi:hypothetical protein
MIRACGRLNRLPGAPQASRTCPIEATRPIAYVETSLLMKFIVSRIASPADTEPPGELM